MLERSLSFALAKKASVCAILLLTPKSVNSLEELEFATENLSEFYPRAKEVRNPDAMDWSLMELDGEILKQRGEIIVRVAKITETPGTDGLYLSDEELRLSVKEAAEKWNEVLWNIDPSIQFTVADEPVNKPCRDGLEKELPEGEVLVCSHSKETWETRDGEHSYNKVFAYVKPTVNYQKGLHFSGSTVYVRNYIPDFITVRPDDTEPFKQDILTHELGHILGLFHPSEWGLESRESTMASKIDVKHVYEPFSGIDLGTIDGLEELYAKP